MLHYYVRTRDSWMVDYMHEVFEMYQQATHASLRAERHASHCHIQSTSDEFVREHSSAAPSLLEAARQAVPRMSKKGKRPRSPSYWRLVLHDHAVLHPAKRTRPHLAIRRDPLGCHIAQRQPMTAMGLVMAIITHRTVVVPPTHMQQATYLSSLHRAPHTCRKVSYMI